VADHAAAGAGDGPAPTTTPAPEPAPAPAYDQGALGAVPADAEGPPVEGVAPDGDADRPVPEPDPVALVTAERDDFLDQLQRSRADYDNLNKRRLREVAEARDRGAAALAHELLEVIDNFGFALRAAEQSDDAQLAKGVQLVHDQLLGVLQSHGLEEVPGAGSPFDPAHHEALMSESDDTDRDVPEVGEVLRTGYRFKQQLLRPASVKVLE
jgi:molecular chaperone GrpE